MGEFAAVCPPSKPSWTLPPPWLFADRRLRPHLLLSSILLPALPTGRNFRSAQYPLRNQTYSYPSLGGLGGSTPNIEMEGYGEYGEYQSRGAWLDVMDAPLLMFRPAKPSMVVPAVVSIIHETRLGVGMRCPSNQLRRRSL